MRTGLKVATYPSVAFSLAVWYSGPMRTHTMIDLDSTYIDSGDGDGLVKASIDSVVVNGAIKTVILPEGSPFNVWHSVIESQWGEDVALQFVQDRCPDLLSDLMCNDCDKSTIHMVDGWLTSRGTFYYCLSCGSAYQGALA